MKVEAVSSDPAAGTVVRVDALPACLFAGMHVAQGEREWTVDGVRALNGSEGDHRFMHGRPGWLQLRGPLQPSDGELSCLGERVWSAIAAHRTRLRCINEARLQESLAVAFNGARIPFTREVSASKQDRFDFLMEEGLIIEVKVKGSMTELARQLSRYAAHTAVAAMVVVTTRVLHEGLPARLGAKPVVVLHVGPWA